MNRHKFQESLLGLAILCLLVAAGLAYLVAGWAR